MAKAQKAVVATAEQRVVQIPAPKMNRAEFHIVGTAPYVMARFSKKAMDQMTEKHEAGSQAKKGAKKVARDFNADYEGAKHISTDGWVGIHAGSIRAAMISACRLVGFKMTLAKLSLFVEADGYDAIDGVPLIKIEGEPEKAKHMVRNATGVADIRVRPMWREWGATLRIKYDADQFSLEDITNLLARVGQQVGLGEGRPDSKSSAGMGWGTFMIEGHDEN
jgi:hypothetical protein